MLRLAGLARPTHKLGHPFLSGGAEDGVLMLVNMTPSGATVCTSKSGCGKEQRASS